MSSQSLVLYECPATRSDRVKFLLEEMQIPYEKKTLILSKSEHLSKEYLEINPSGCVPFLIDSSADVKLIESGAICHYLAQKYKKNIYFPSEKNIKEQVAYDEVMFFITSTLDPICFNLFFHTKRLPPEKRIASIAEESIKKFSRTIEFISAKLEKNKYLLSDKLSTPDFILVPTLLCIKEEVMKYPIVQRYIQNILELSSMQKVREDIKSLA
ncbi:glutathione S-transferase family protein [Pigmentibacter sp. JX0631]|uniref:glutathione S-transferase family protein n=1 Tax=Pigmentibacter sp. JX0631 TaxID=2976982 RepID=UPI002469C24F|nr:glutathione S-transferase family protein [Pigmentibacter sp. JX0631]WGL61016.1 glutathione S-transferase family protein [Pigmentibacter sp. JX0631]